MTASLIAPMYSLLIQPVASSLINAISGKVQGGGFLPLSTLPLKMKVLGIATRAGRGYNSMDKTFLVPLHTQVILRLLIISITSLGLMVFFSKRNLSGVKDRAYVINLDDKKNKGAHWVSLFITRNRAVYFNSFWIQCIPEEVLSEIKDKFIMHNIFIMQDDNFIMCGFCSILFTEYMITRKMILDYTNLFSPNDYQKNDKIIYKYFKDKYGRRKRNSWL